MKKLLFILFFAALCLAVESQIPRFPFARATTVVTVENMLANGSLTAPVTQWATNNTDSWTFSDGVAYFNYEGSTGRIYQESATMTDPVVAETAYTLTFDITFTSGTQCQIAVTNYNTSVTYAGYATKSGTSVTISFTTPASVGDGGLAIVFNTFGSPQLSIDNILLVVD